MPVLTATLAQDLSDFRAVVDPLIRAARRQWYPSHEQLLLWVICEELEECYGLFHRSHIHNDAAGLEVREYIRSHMPPGVSLSQWFCFWIKAPKVYADYNEVLVSTEHQDLFIQYFSSSLNLPFNIDYERQNNTWTTTSSQKILNRTTRS